MCSKIISLNRPQAKQHLVFAAWHFAHAALWRNQSFSAGETRKACGQILAHLLNGGKYGKKEFIVFCQRILLAVMRSRKPVNVMPSVWLHPTFDNGYGETAAAFEQFQESVKKVPGIHPFLLLIPLVYYETVNAISSSRRFHFLRLRLIQANELQLLALLCHAVAYSSFLPVEQKKKS